MLDGRHGLKGEVPADTPVSFLRGRVSLRSLVSDATFHHEDLALLSSWKPFVNAEKKLLGSVWLDVLVDPDGEVTNAEVRLGVPFIDDAAVLTVLRWRFEPMKINGQAVSALHFVGVEFKVR